MHFTGVAGSGMSALAQHRAFGGARTSGSDRGFDQGQLQEERARLERLGIAIWPQDGTGVRGAAAVVASTAVEAGVPDLVQARALAVPVIHRADLLGHLVGAGPSVAIAGTSGKSTVTAMVFEILSRSGRDPGLVTGGDLLALAARGVRGNAWRGAGPLVVEADESDRSLVKHAPEIGVVLNLHRDHVEPAEAHEIFETFVARTRGTALISDDPELEGLRGRARVFGFGKDADAAFRGEDLEVLPRRSRFRFGGAEVLVPVPGRHNAANALAALAAAVAAGVDPADAAAALAGFAGVGRRFQILGEPGGVTVVDDFAHNPRKVEAALRAAQAIAPRVFAYFQPHGFAPARFMRAELAERVAATLRPADRFCVGEIYFAGGTAARDIGAADLAADLAARGARADPVHARDIWAESLPGQVRPGDLALVMGARDPTLPAFARSLLVRLGGVPL